MEHRNQSRTGIGFRPRLEQLEPRVVLNGGPIINEMVAVNNRSFQDYDDDWTDWIEVANPSTSPMNLRGYYLTDDAADLRKWQVPTDTLLEPGEHLVVFASGKDFVAPTGELHTNFNLNGDGEYLALIEPDGETIAWEFISPLADGDRGFPKQLEDISYGVGVNTVLVPLVTTDATIEYLVPTSAEQLSENWKDLDFADPDGVWTASSGGNGSPGGNGVGFQGQGDEFNGLIQTDLTGVMDGVNASAFVRAEFEVPSGVTLEDLTLGVRYNDGFVVYLNGTEVARRNAPASPVWNSAATAERDNIAAVQVEEIPLTVGRLLSDLHNTKDNTFLVDLPAGQYDVTIRQGDLTKVRDQMAILLEGVLVDTVTSQAGEVLTNRYRVEVTDGQLSLQLLDQGGVTGRAVINALVITPVNAADGFGTMTLDFGGLSSPLEPGTIQIHEGSRYASEVGHGWLTDDFHVLERPPEVGNLQLVQEGPNVLSFQGLNVDATNADFLLQFELSGTRIEADASQIGYFLEPTPGQPNSTWFEQEVVTPPAFSVNGGTFRDDFMLELTTDGPDEVIHYSLDLTVPTAGSLVFDPASPISITTTTQVRARVFTVGKLPSPVVSQTFVKLAANVLNFRSQLPLMIIDNFGNGPYGKAKVNDFENAYWAIFEPQDSDGLSSLLNKPDLQTRAGVRVRGRGSRKSQKNSFALEAWDEKDQDKDVSPLGLPADSDWILNGADFVDRALMRNAFAYELSNQTGRYAVRTRFVEVFSNTNGGVLNRAEYRGIYTFMEKIKRGKDRVDVEKLSKHYNSEPLITGGYMFKIDEEGRGDSGFVIRGQTFQYVEPKEVEIEEPGREPQVEYIQEYLNDTFDSLSNPDPLTGYPSFIAIDSWVDYHLLSAVPLNVDTFVGSTFFFKRRDGLLEYGPVWDFDKSMGSETRSCCPKSFSHEQLFSTFLWVPLWEDADFRQKWIDRYQQLREGEWQTENIQAILASLAAQLTRDAADRNFNRWGLSNWLGEVDSLRKWLEERVNWIDGRMIPKPQIDPPFSQGGLKGLPPAGSFAFDFGPADSIVREGYIGMGDEPFDENVGYGWTSGTDFNLVDRETAAVRGGDFVAVGGPATFSVDLDNGTYDVTVLMGDSSNVRDQMQLRLEPGEETEVRDAVTVTQQWKHRKTYTVEVEDGQLNLELSDLGGSSTQAVINALVITPSDIDNGLVPAGSTFTLNLPQSAPEGTKVYYTLDGTDPRISIIAGGTAEVDGDRISTSAREYTGEQITIDGPTTIRARAFLPDSTRSFGFARQTIDWSGLMQVSLNVQAPQLAITEINFNPASPTGDELAVDPNFDNDDFEFIELQNVGTGPAELTGYSFTDGVEYSFSSLTLEPQGYAIVVRNQEAFETRYGTDHNVVGEYSGGLANRGDQLMLSDVGDNVVLSFQYDDNDPWPERADGSGATLELIEPQRTPAEQYGKYYRWRAGTQFGGSPGAPGEAPLGVVINEVRTRGGSQRSDPDAIELYNPTDSPVDIGGMYLSDTDQNFLKYPIPTGTLIPAGGYHLFDESDFNPTPNDPQDHHFALSGTQGDDVWLVVVDKSGNVVRFVDDVHFGAAEQSESFGRAPEGSGRLVPMTSITLEEPNSAPRVGPLLISEIQYHPGPPTAEALASYADLDENDLEYVEIYNPTAEQVDLGGWELSGGIEITLDAGTLIGAGEALVVVSFNPDRKDNVNRVAAFRQHYGLDENVRLVGGYTGSLSNGGELLELLRPGTPDAADPAIVPQVVEDETLYDDLAPWPTGADGGGKSLVRSGADSPGQLAESWMAADPSPGLHALIFAGDLDMDGDIDFDDIDDLLLAMNDPAAYEAKFGVSALVAGDFDQDGKIDDADIGDFVLRLGNGN